MEDRPELVDRQVVLEISVAMLKTSWSYVSSLEMKEVCADLTRFVPGRRLDDDGTVLIRFRGWCEGIYISQSDSCRARKRYFFRNLWDQGSMEWKHSDPNSSFFGVMVSC